MLRLAPLLILALLLAAPFAGAHVEEFSQGKTVPAGPYTVYLEPRPAVIFSNTTLSMTAQVYFTDTGARARDVTASLLVAGPNEFSKRTEMRDDGSGYLVAAILLPHRGLYSARLFVKDANQTFNADTEFEAYPDLAVRVRSIDTTDPTVGQPTTLTFQVVNRTTLRPFDGLDDLGVRMEQWDDEHLTMKGVENATLVEEDDGRWRLEHTFRAQGMYHLKFFSRSGGFTYDEVPILHTYASAPRAAEGDGEGTNKLPAPAAPLVLALLGAVALGLARRRHP